MVRDSGHVIALDAAAMATAATGRPHRRKERIPPGPAAKAAAAQLLQLRDNSPALTESVHLQPIPLSSTCPLMSGPPRKGPCNDPHRTHPENHQAIDESPSAAASRYQQLRSHLAELKLHAAAEALPTVLDHATAEGLSLTVALERLLAVEVDASTQPAGWRAGCGSPACPPRPPWPTSTSTPPPGSTVR